MGETGSAAAAQSSQKIAAKLGLGILGGRLPIWPDTLPNKDRTET
jgi:hypothetical protein